MKISWWEKISIGFIIANKIMLAVSDKEIDEMEWHEIWDDIGDEVRKYLNIKLKK